MGKGSRAKPTVISLFCGIGGSSLGYKMAGYRELAAVDWDRLALETFRRNFPRVPTVEANLFEYTPRHLMGAVGIVKGELDVLDGSPPCQGFSTSGKRREGDRRNGLVLKYAQMVRALQPRVAIMENVPGMVSGKMRPAFDEFMEKIGEAGYRADWGVLSAADYGVPQDRKRVIMVAVRKDLGVDPVFPAPSAERQTVEQALAGMKRQEGIPIDGIPVPEVLKRLLKEIRPGHRLLDVAQRDQGVAWGFNDRRLHADRPALTLTATVRMGQGGYMLHPAEDRLLSIAELKVLCGFPAGYVLGGSYEEMVKGLGNAVMPPFMAAVAGEVRRRVLS